MYKKNNNLDNMKNEFYVLTYRISRNFNESKIERFIVKIEYPC